MPRLRRRKVSNEIEKEIVTGMIVDDRYCQDAVKMIRKSFFQIDFAARVAFWVSDYYDSYRKAPGKDIQNIFEVEKDNLKEAEEDLISVFLAGLSDNYEQENFNREYLLDRTIFYFGERSLDLLSKNISGYLGRGRPDLAVDEVRKYSEIAKTISNWSNPLEEEVVIDSFMDTDKTWFKLPGALGNLIGDLEREWLLCFIGPMKRGKSFYLQEVAIHAITSKLKVAYISLEINKKNMLKRLYRRLMGKAKREGVYKYPIFDCVYNQDGTCEKKERQNSIKLLDENGNPPDFKPRMRYRVCTYCRGEKGGDYAPAVWSAQMDQKEPIKLVPTRKKVKRFKKMYGDNLRVIAYPAFSATFDDIERDLDYLEYTEGFVADVICVDYFDILAKEDSGVSERGNIDATWKRGKRIAGERKALMASVSQSNRGSITKKNVTQIDTAEDIRKIAHLDVAAVLNQTREEKRQGVMRIAVIAHRHEDFDEMSQVIVLQQLSIGVPLLDSERYFSPRTEETD